MNRLQVKVLLIVGILMAMASVSQAQEVRTKTGFGYYDPRIGGDTGNVFYTDIMVKLPSDFFVGAGFGLSDVFTSYSNSDPLFAGFRTIRNYYHFRAMIAKEFALGKKERHIINLGTGLTYVQLRYTEPYVTADQNGNLIGKNLTSDRRSDDAGFLFNADYSYRIGHFSIGVRGEIQYHIAVGLGGIIVSPQIGINF